MIIVAIVSAPFGGTSYREVWNDDLGIWQRIPVQHLFVAGVISFLYYWLLHSYWNGQTVGKKAFGMRVVDATGVPVSVGQAALRQLVEVVLGWLCFIGSLLDLGWILFDDHKQALHDKAAKTLVVDT